MLPKGVKEETLFKTEVKRLNPCRVQEQTFQNSSERKSSSLDPPSN